MNRLEHKRQLLQRRKARIRSRVKGTTDQPRLSVTISNRSVSAQIINDETGVTLASAANTGKVSSDIAAEVGKQIAQVAKKQKITRVVFDSNGRQYQQRLRRFADAARNEGLEF